MNKERISEFVDVWAQTIGLTETKYINVIKSDIAKRCAMYEKNFPTISANDDKCKAYIIKPVNGEYSIEDFFLNRLMLGLREVSFTGALEGNAGEYVAHDKTLNVNVNLLDKKISDKSTRHKGLQGKNIQIIKKTIEHELGHCFKSAFNDGFKAPLGKGREQDVIYKNLITNLLNYKNGKYANQIKQIQEFNLEEFSDVIKTGVLDSKVNYQQDYRVQWIDELLNETEALELTNNNEVQEKWELQDEHGKNSTTGNYVNVYNYMSGYSTFTGYGSILKALLGKEDSFSAEYISSTEIFKKFDEEYADIVEEVWGLDPKQYPPIKCIYMDFQDLVNGKFFNEEIMLKLDEFFAKCYERKIEKNISNGTLSPEETLKDIEQFQAKLTTNDDPQKREQLVHNVIFNNIKTRINELSIQNSQPKREMFEKTVAKSQMRPSSEQLEEKKEMFTSLADKGTEPTQEELRMKFVNGFIQAYNDTEEEYQYETRVEDEQFNMQRVQEIIETNGLNRMLISDLDGKWIGTPSDEDFKVQYSQKQVSAMARLLKSAELLTNNKKINPEGRNYLAEFTAIPDIEYKLKQMKNDFKDESSYMFELRQKARDNRANGTLPDFPATPAEIDASDTSWERGQGLKQEHGQRNTTTENENEKKMSSKRKIFENPVVQSEEENQQMNANKRKMFEKQVDTKNEEGKYKKKIEGLRASIKKEKVAKSDANTKMEEINKRNELKRLNLRIQLGAILTAEEQQRRDMLEQEFKSKQKAKKKQQGQMQGHGMGR